MDRLFVLTASDGSSLILGEDPADPRQPFRRVFQHDGHGPPEPLRGALTADGRVHATNRTQPLQWGEPVPPPMEPPPPDDDDVDWDDSHGTGFSPG